MKKFPSAYDRVSRKPNASQASPDAPKNKKKKKDSFRKTKRNSSLTHSLSYTCPRARLNTSQNPQSSKNDHKEAARKKSKNPGVVRSAQIYLYIIPNKHTYSSKTLTQNPQPSPPHPFPSPRHPVTPTPPPTPHPKPRISLPLSKSQSQRR